MFKQVLIVRTDLGMGRGKMAAQVAHAAVSSYLVTTRSRPEWAERWLLEGQKKVVLRVDSLDELLEIARSAERAGLPYSSVEDAGLTQLEPGTVTSIGIGPAPEELLTPITGHLRLL
ncbi:MAG: peptidyl-tRNA hydrolase Pth2 [Aigarchaeota archaeon]|nr:peptidyl-tRNA hydrolase Pth2 [Aigarchaeota archaeon]MDW8092268.1 peptidyl-tRNA hydrolase Pth2 [Nitrososphaerota archaeon]